MIGQILSHYKILEKIGEGGMGIVYKALDTRLDRTVALKFMPHHIIPDEAEEARFLQEAKAASALNHPHVCTIYGIHDGDGNKFIEMEFIEGVTLRQKLPISSLTETINYAVQIGDALYEAHQKGIVHRDIKADNIMINTKNQVKVMDFGLAKLKGSLKLTKATSTVGTLAYMAPEQIQGGDVDARSDIFSYGVLLYEMLTGRMPFRIEHEAALMYSIINDDPDPIQKYRQDLSPILMNLIQRALEKDPNDRYQSINEMVIELRRLQKQSTKVSRTSLSSMPVQPAPAEYQSISSATVPVAEQKKSKKGMLIGISAVIILIIAAVLWKFMFTPSSQLALNANMTFRTLQIPFQEIGYPSLSRDGGWVAFAGNARGTAWDIYLMNTGSGDPRQITTDSAGFMQDVDLSPDGSQIVYDRSDKGFTKPEIAIVSSLGGFSKRIVNIGFFPKWRPDGQRIAYMQTPQWGSKSGKTEVRSVKPNGSDDRLEFSDSLRVGIFSWSPDGSEIAWTRRTTEGHFELFARNLESGQERQLTSLKKSIGTFYWTQNNEIVFSSNLNGNQNLWMIPATGGTPVQITRGSGPDIAPAVSADLKRLLYVQQQSVGKIWYGSVQGNDARQLTYDDIDIANPAFSNDGRKILYVVATPNPSGSTSSIFVFDISSGQKTELLSEEQNIHSPKWSPDGKWIVFAMHPDTVQHDSTKTYIIDAENQGMLKEVGVGFPEIWIDHKTFLTTNPAGTWVCTIDGAPVKTFFRDSTYAQPVLDGKYVVYSDVIPYRTVGLWIEPAISTESRSSEAKQLIKSLGKSVYDHTTKSLYYTSPQNDLRRVYLPGGKEEIVRGTFPNLRLGTDFSISPDGRQIIYLDSKSVSKLVMIENFH